MRTIKFRGKCIADGEFNGKWVYGDLLQKNEKAYITPHSNSVSMNGQIGKLMIMHEVDPETVGQYTGQKNFDEIELYEGTILHFIVFDYNGVDTQHKGVIKWVDENCAFIIANSIESDEGYWLYWVLAQDDEVEVIGSLYDNSELLEVQHGNNPQIQS